MMNRTAEMNGSPATDSLLEGKRHEAGMGAADPPPHDIPSVNIDNEGYTGKSSPRGYIGKIGDPEPFGRRGFESVAAH